MDNIKLSGDTISNLRQFYERIRLAFHSSFTKVIDILPSFREISQSYPFGHLLVPQNEYYIGYYSIFNTYNWFATALCAGLTDSSMICSKKAPLAFRVKLQHYHLNAFNYTTNVRNLHTNYSSTYPSYVPCNIQRFVYALHDITTWISYLYP